jgi:hypothetical protein
MCRKLRGCLKMHLGVSLSGVEGHFQQIGLHFDYAQCDNWYL